ncbi:MAG: DEAD/DEAH box helicase family protein [Bacteroidetes bacterium]|nr:DEAD/DEAH box helicase family protein [Bacteroidota bacterium]
MQFTPYHAKFFAYELTKRSASDSMQKLAATLVDAQVDLNPHQVEAALFAFRSPLSKGAILADEVGLGKTIEAGLVISQKWAERKRKILIITPANLRKQWSQELQDKFFLPSFILEAKSFNDTIKTGNLNPFNQAHIILCSYQFARTKEAYLRLVDWDLVVIDEAHRLRNVYKTSNKIARSIKESLEHAPKILLTATPLQNSLLELYGLVSIIDDYAFGDLKSFRSQYSKVNSTLDEGMFKELKERLKPICKRTLRRQVLEYIKYTNRIALVEEFYPTQEEQRLYDLVSEYLQGDTLYALPSSQRQLMTLILRRLLASSTFAISKTLGALVAKLENIVARHDEADEFEATVAEDFETYDELKDEWNEEEEAKEEQQFTPADIDGMRDEIVTLKEFEDLAISIDKNSKGEKLFTALENGFRELQRLGAPRKAIIFTESTRTQEYIRANLETRGYEGEVVLFNGSNSDQKSREIYNAWIEQHKNTDRISGSRTADIRAALVDYFREEATIMIATEAAAEGINLQFCSLLINYDLPWNPQRIEQRIGRCHRYGQKYDVVVVNFLNKANAADQRVYALLRDKFNLFNGVFGASDEVLGSIENGIDFEKRIAKIYQDCRTIEQIEVAFNILQSELEGQISNAMQQTRQQLLENFDEEVHEKLKINLQESREYLSKYENLLWDITRFYLNGDAIFATADEHSFRLINNPFPGTKIHPGPYRIGKSIDDANVYRIGHPLAQLIIGKCKDYDLPARELIFDYTGNQKIITILASLCNKSGWIMAEMMSVTSFEEEDHIILTGICDDGTALEEEHCRRLFSLSAHEGSEAALSPTQKEALIDDLSKKKNTILGEIGARNANFFDMELEKLDKWGDDRRSSLKATLKELDAQIKDLKKQARIAPNLPEKLKLERERQRIESDRDKAWREYDEAAKEIDQGKDRLIDEIEKKLQQLLSTTELFLIRWTIK